MNQALSTLLAMHGSLNLGIFDLTEIQPEKWNSKSCAGDLLFHHWKVTGKTPDQELPPESLAKAIAWSFNVPANTAYQHQFQRAKRFSKKSAMDLLLIAIKLEEVKQCPANPPTLHATRRQ